MGNLTRVDQNTGYRYECPDCGSVQIYRIRDAATSAGKTETFPANGWGPSQKRDALKRNYKCNNCRATHESVIDKKRDGQLARP